MTTVRRSRTTTVLTAAVVAVIVVIGVIAVVLHNSSDSSSGQHSVAELKSFAAKVPLPAGAALTDETVTEPHGDVGAFLRRAYTLPGAAQSSVQIQAALRRGDCRLADPRSDEVATVDSALWTGATTAEYGDVFVLPPGTKGGGIELNWQGEKLVLRVSGGDVESTG